MPLRCWFSRRGCCPQLTLSPTGDIFGLCDRGGRPKHPTIPRRVSALLPPSMSIVLGLRDPRLEDSLILIIVYLRNVGR